MDSPDRLHSNEPTLDLKKFAKEAAAALTKDILEFVGKPHEFPPHESDVLTFELLHQVNVKLYKMGRDIPQERSSQFAITTIQYVIDALQKSKLRYFEYYTGLLRELVTTHPSVPERYTAKKKTDLLSEEARLQAQEILMNIDTAPTTFPAHRLGLGGKQRRASPPSSNPPKTSAGHRVRVITLPRKKEQQPTYDAIIREATDALLAYLDISGFEIQQGNEYYYDLLEWVQKYIEGLDENYAPENFHECAIAVSNEMLRVIESSGHSAEKFTMKNLREDFDAIHERILTSRERKILCIGYAIAANGLSKVFARKILTEGGSMEVLTEGMFTRLQNVTSNVSSDVRFAFVHATLHQTYRRLLAAGIPSDDRFVCATFRNLVEKKIEGASEAYFKPPALAELQEGLKAERAEANSMHEICMLPNPPENAGMIHVSDIIRVLPPIDKDNL